MQIYTLFFVIFPVVSVFYLNSRMEGKYTYKAFACITLIVYFLFIAFRPFDIGTDTKNYINFYALISKSKFNEIFEFRFEPLFSTMSFFFAFFDSERVYIASIALVHTILFYVCGRKWFDGKLLLIYTVITLSVFTTYNLGTNILRQGLAIPLALIATFHLVNKDKCKFLIYATACIAMHYTSSIMIICSVLALIRGRIGYYVVIWFFAILLLYFNSLDYLISNLRVIFVGHSSYQDILSDNSLEVYRVGFRLDFILYSSIPILLHFFLDRKLLDGEYYYLIRLYLILNTIFIICMIMPYSDRIGIYSWSLFPIYLAYTYRKSRYSLINNSVFFMGMIIVFAILGLSFYPLMTISTLIW